MRARRLRNVCWFHQSWDPLNVCGAVQVSQRAHLTHTSVTSRDVISDDQRSALTHGHDCGLLLIGRSARVPRPVGATWCMWWQWTAEMEGETTFHRGLSPLQCPHYRSYGIMERGRDYSRQNKVDYGYFFIPVKIFIQSKTLLISS